MTMWLWNGSSLLFSNEPYITAETMRKLSKQSVNMKAAKGYV